MGLLGNAAIVLYFGVPAHDAAEHDNWHTHEHMPERLAIPGFLRGSRWSATEGGGYMVVYEVTDLPVLTSPAYLARLDDPTPWTREVMKSYRGMHRGLCRLQWKSGRGLGGMAASFRFRPAAGAEARLSTWLTREALPELAARPGLASASLLEAAANTAMTREQTIRGRDGAVEWVVLVTGYDAGAVARLAQEDLAAERFLANGAEQAPLAAAYRLAYALSREP
jgi:hypothetical protein